MKEQYLQKVPTWYKSEKKFEVVLSDDIDGLVSTSALKYTKDWDVEYFYNFENLYINNELYFKKTDKSATRVWADVSIVIKDEKTFDNHINRVNLNDYTNPNAINPNILTDVTNENYYDKYLGSSALVIWSLYNIPLPKTELGKMILLAIDTTFKGFYGKDQYRRRNKFYLCDVLGLEELYEVEQRHEMKEFYQLIDKYNLSRKIRMNDSGRLETEMDLELLGELLGIPIVLPSKTFGIWRTLENKFSTFYGLEKIKDIPRLITIAFTGKSKGKYSTLVKQ